MTTEMERVWFVKVAGQEKPQGPYTWKEIQDRLAQGGLRPDALCFKQGMTEWIPVAKAIALSRHTSPVDVRPRPVVRRRPRSRVPIVKLVVVLVVVGVGGFFAVTHRAEILAFLKDQAESVRTDESTAGPGPADGSSAGSENGAPEESPELDVKALCERASSAVARGDLDRASGLWEEVLARSEGKASLEEEAALAERTLHWIDLTQNPDRRFVIMGALVGVKTVVMLKDLRDGADFRVQQGESFAGFRLDSYDAEQGTAQISFGRQRYTIRAE